MKPPAPTHRRRELVTKFQSTVRAYERPFIFLGLGIVLWLLIGWPLIVFIGDEIKYLPRYKKYELLVGMGCLLLVVLALRSVWRTYQRRKTGEHAAMARVTASLPMTGTHPLSRTAPQALLPTWRTLCGAYENDYAEWVMANVDADFTGAEVLEFAKSNHVSWSEVNNRSDESKARHAAARAVVAHVLGCTITRISISTDQTSEVRTTVHLPIPRTHIADQSWTMMSILLAGRTHDVAN